MRTLGKTIRTGYLCARSRIRLRTKLKSTPNLFADGSLHATAKSGLLVIASCLAVASASAATFVPNYLKYEYFPGHTRTEVEDGTAGAPASVGNVLGSGKSGYISSYETGVNYADNYASRISGFFVPPATGDYHFVIATDDDSDLFLSTDDNPANKRAIASETGWSASRNWNSSNGGDALQKNSKTYVATDGTTPFASGIHLVGGQKYYIESVQHEGGGGDNHAVAYYLASGTPPSDGSAPNLTGAAIGVNVDAAIPTPTLDITVPPIGGTFYTSGKVGMIVGATSDSQFPILYQWRKGGAAIAGATGAEFAIGKPAAGDAGSYDVVVSVPGPSGSISKTSAPVNVTIKDATVGFVAGSLKYEYFPGSDRGTVEGPTPPAPSFGGATVGSDSSGYITTFESGVNFADNYANRISALFVPPTTGDYVFYVSGDDDSDLFLSTDENPSNKKLIAREASWSNNRQWNTGGGGSSTTENKRSDSFDASEWPTPNQITLTAGKRYYLEGVHHEGGGGDDFGATFRLASDDEALTADGTPSRLTGNVVGSLIPQIIAVAGTKTGVRSFGFNIADSGPSVLDPASVKLTFDGVTVTPTASPKANGVTAFTYTFPTQLLPGTSHIYTVQAADTTAQPITTSGSFNLPLPWFPKEDLKGPAVVKGAWAQRFIWGVKDANDAVVQITGLASILTKIQQVGTPDFIGQTFDLTNSVVNYNAGGLFGNPVAYPDEVINGTDWTGEDFIELNIGHIVISEEGDYTFGVHSDDGFAMRIRGGQTVSVAGNGQLDPVDPEAIVHPGDTGDSNTRAVYHLKKGVYRMEMFWWERGGGDNGELYGAKGAWVNDGDTQAWKLVGDNTLGQDLISLGVDNNGWTVISSDPGGDDLPNWDAANADLAATGGGAKNYDALNVGDPDTNGGVQAFPKNTPADDDHYAMKATGTLVVPEDGTYIIGFNSDDGAYVKVTGKNFTEIIQNNTGTSAINGDTVTCDCLTGDSGTTATITLTKGNYAIEAGMFESGGGSFLAVKGAKQPAGAVGTGDLPILAKGKAGTVVHTPDPLQLTDAAPFIDNGGGGGPTITVTRTGNNLNITWTPAGGNLESSPTLGTGATWTTIGSQNPATVAIGTGNLFIRVKK